ncbi:MAG: hypothetical protein PHG81_05535 [Aliarcobacter sp.]|nr:hypothetical protein [Aliarcobacter sp.]
MNTQQLRVKYNNEWPNKFLFDVEKQLTDKLNNLGLKVINVVKLKENDDNNFQTYLGYLIDSLDMLPLRPDFAFDNIWKALDAEFFVIQNELNQNNTSRFDAFIDEILINVNVSTAFIKYLNVIPEQTCKYAAKRIIESSLKENNNQETLYRRAQSSLSESFINEFVNKYPPSSNKKPIAGDLRNAGKLLKKVFNKEKISLNGVDYTFNDNSLIKFLLKIVLANYRNERFHGAVFSPFRSSTATLDTYAHAYFLFHLSYALLLDVFLYREYEVTTIEEVNKYIDKNIDIYSKLFQK